LNKPKRVLRDGVNEHVLLRRGGMVDAPLDDTAAMAVSSGRNHVLADDVENELVVLLLKIVQALLQNVVSVDVLCKCHNRAAEGLCDRGNLQFDK
jgi:hypothetical protein